MNDNFEKIIIYYLLNDKIYFDKVITHLFAKLFLNDDYALLLKIIKKYLKEYKEQPKIDSLVIYLVNLKISDKKKEKLNEILEDLRVFKPALNLNTLLIETEKWIKQRSLEDAIIKSAEILQKPDENKEIIEDLVKKALSINIFDNLGHNYVKDVKDRLEAYKETEEYTSTNLLNMDEALGGGFAKKALYVFAGKTNIGKTLWLVNFATGLLKSGANVVYFTAEMSEMRIAQRIDANLLEIDINELSKISDEKFIKMFKNEIKKYSGKLIIKEYPTSTASAKTIETFLDDLRIKENFTPDFIIVDYLNIFTSYRLPRSSYADTYNYYRSITEELRSLAVQYNIGVITATQINRASAKIKNFDLIDDTATSDSYGISFTTDFQGIIIQNSQLRKENKYLLKVVKTRFGANNNEIYTFDVNYNFMKLYDSDEQEVPKVVEEQEQEFSFEI